MNHRTNVDHASGDYRRDATAAAFAAALLNVGSGVQVEHSRVDLLHTARILAAQARLSDTERSVLNRLLEVVGDDSSSAERVRRGVRQTQALLSEGRS
ncbi:MAG: hypothetical protein ACK5H2_14155 [Beutenbergiaceae bacterium]